MGFPQPRKKERKGNEVPLVSTVELYDLQLSGACKIINTQEKG